MTTRPDPAPHATEPAAIALLGLGEVGRIYGEALARAGHQVTGYDPATTEPVTGVEFADTARAAVANARLVFTLTSAAASHAVARSVVDAVPDGAIYADFTSSGPSQKAELAQIFTNRSRVGLVDVAILGPVIQLGPGTPLMVAGNGASGVAEAMTGIGATVETVDGRLGDAMGHKLLRSVFMKSLAAAVTEAVEAGRAAGHEEWIRNQIARELAGDGQRTIDRFLRGTALHGERRSHEMDAAADYLHSMNIPPTMARAAATLHRRLQPNSGSTRRRQE